MTNEHRLVFTAKTCATRLALADVRVILADQGYGSEEIGTVELVLAEVINNIVEHAYADQDPGDIELGMNFRGKDVLCAICDSGAPMPDDQPPIGQAVDVDCAVDDLPEGGFGWFMIRALVHDLHYERMNDKNRVTFRLAIGSSEPMRQAS